MSYVSCADASVSFDVSKINLHILPWDRWANGPMLRSLTLSALSPTYASPHAPYSKPWETAGLALNTSYEVSVISVG